MRNSPNSTIKEEHILVPLGVCHAGLVRVSSTDVPVDLHRLVEHVLSFGMLAFVTEGE